MNKEAEQIRLLKNVLDIDNSRLVDDCILSGIEYMGCDTPHHLASTIVELKEELHTLRENLKLIQWGCYGECPNCSADVTDGHEDNCWIVKVLQEVQP